MHIHNNIDAAFDTSLAFILYEVVLSVKLSRALDATETPNVNTRGRSTARFRGSTVFIGIDWVNPGEIAS